MAFGPRFTTASLRPSKADDFDASPLGWLARAAFVQYVAAMIVVRRALPEDAPTLHRFIVELAVYEKEPDAVEIDADQLGAQMRSERPPFEAWIAEDALQALGFALTFPTYSTWKGRSGMWLEDFYVTPEARGRGVGAALLRELSDVCVDRGYGRLELTALRWNELARHFYDKRGAVEMKEWTRWRFTSDALRRLLD